MSAKTIIPLLLLITLLLGCSEKCKNQYDGSWKLIEAKWSANDSVYYQYPGNITSMDGSWILTDTHSIYLMKYVIEGDSTVIVDYSKSSITIANNILTETYLVSNEKKLEGQTLTFNVEVKGDTLIFKGPLGNGKEISGYDLYEVFVRE